MKRKIAKLIMCICVLTASFMLAQAVCAATVVVESTECLKGQEVKVYVAMKQNSGFASLGIELEYDQDVLRLTDVSESKNVGATFTKAQSYTKMPYNLSWNHTENCTFNGTLATLTFEVLTETNGEYPIEISYYKGRNRNYTDGYDVNYDSFFRSINLEYQDGIVEVKSGNKINITVNGKEMFVVSDKALTGTILVPMYNRSGRMKSINKCSVSQNMTTSFDEANEGNYTKVLWWESLATLKPKHNYVEAQMN